MVPRQYHDTKRREASSSCYYFDATTSPFFVARSSIIDVISRIDGLIICVAPTGFGKTTLAGQLPEHARSFSKITSVSPSKIDLIAEEIKQLPSSRRSLLILDGVNANGLDYLGEVMIPDGHAVVALGREEPIPSLLRNPGTTYLSEPEFRFNFQEILALARIAIGEKKAESLAHLLDSMTEGWPEHVVRVLEAISGQEYSPETAHILMHDGDHLSDLITRCLAGLNSEIRVGLEQLSHLSTFSAAAADAFVPGLISEAGRVGFPLLHRTGGTIQIPALLRVHLNRETKFEEQSAQILAPLLVATLGVPEALRSLLSAGATAEAASIVCEISPNQLAASNQAHMLGILRAIEAAEPDNSRVTLRRAGVHRNLAQLGSERQAVVQALEKAEQMNSSQDMLAAEVELLRIDLRGLDEDDAEVRLQRLEQVSVPLASSPVRLGIRELRAMMLAERSDLQSVYRSIELLSELASEWEHLGDRSRSAQLLRLMAAGPLNDIGDYRQACLALDRAAKLVWDNPLGMAGTSELLCRFLALVGDSDRFESEITRAAGLIDAIDLRWMAGYLDWAILHSCLWKKDPDGAERALDRALSRIGELADDETGVILLAEAASVLAVLGSAERAQECLDKARRAGSRNHREIAIAQIVVMARCGDPRQVSGLITTLKASGRLPHERLWRIELEQIVANQRLGVDHNRSPAALDRVRSTCEEMGLGPIMTTLLDGHHPLTAGQPASQALIGIKISLLGGFTVTVDNNSLDLAPGHVSQLLKVLAVRGEPLAVEHVVGKLWPDAELPIGKRRLKNVVSRLKSSIDSPIIARLGERISLVETVQTDLAMFRNAAKMAVRPSGGRGIGAAIEALNLYTGHLLPTDLYDDDFTRERDALRAVALSVLDLALDHAEDVAVSPGWLLQVALRLEPDSESPFLRIAEIAEAAGSHECAAAAHSQAQSLARNLGVPLGPRN